MIRINLLPEKRETRKEGGQAWLIPVMLVVAAEIVVLGLYHQLQLQTLEKQRQKNSELQAQITKIQQTVHNHAKVKKRLAALRAREEAILKLQKARSGPTAVLLELSHILTTGRGPTVPEDVLAQKRKDNPQDVFNINWDARRMWLTSFREDHKIVQIQGYARDGEDVSEFARRLSLSEYFSDVKLLPGSQEKDKETGLEVVHFKLQTKVRY